jgi:outer membrane protein assembly factor BamB
MKKFIALSICAMSLMACSTMDKLNPFSTPSTKMAPLPILASSAVIKPSSKSDVGEAGDFVFSPGLVGDAVITASANGKVQRSEQDKAIWKVSLKDQLSGGVGTDGDKVVVGTSRGDVIALDAKDGKELWRSKVGAEILSAPVVADGLVIARASDSRIFAFQATDGKRRWVYQRSSPSLTLRSSAGVTVRGGKTYAGLPGGKLIALLNTNGGMIWEATVAHPKGATELERITDIVSEPVVSAGLVCAVAFQGKVSCFDIATGNGVWSRDISSGAGLDLDDKTLIVTDDKDVIHGLSASSGATLWRQDKLIGRRIGRPLILGKFGLVSDGEGFIHYLAIADGTVTARGAIDDSGVRASLVRSGSTAIVQSVAGYVYRLELPGSL